MEMALLMDDELVHYYVDSVFEENLQNRIVIGQVKQVVKNLKAAFIDYGSDKNGMLHFKQIPECHLTRLQQGYCLPVQITKQNIGEKGHKLTAKLNITGKYLVCLPFEPGIHVSKKISHLALRNQIKEALEEATVNSPYGFIVRTHAGEAELSEIVEDAQKLMAKVEALLSSSRYLVKGSILYEEPLPIYQMLMEQVIKSDEIEVICNDQGTLDKLGEILGEYGEQHRVTLTYCKERQAIFSVYGLTKKIEQITRRKIWLKSGGNLIIDYAEAMTIIDVNSAKAILTKNADKATLELNKEATKEAIMQILRRNLSGMIIVDLVEMKNSAYKLEVYEYAKQLLELYGDSLTKVYPLTELGLLQFSRTKKYQCVSHQLLEACRECHTPYAKESFLMALMKLEEQLGNIQLEGERQAVYLQVRPDFYEKMREKEIVERLEEQYWIKIELSKSSEIENKSILCQFYKR